jgi:hypothetical protein
MGDPLNGESLTTNAMIGDRQFSRVAFSEFASLPASRRILPTSDGTDSQAVYADV